MNITIIGATGMVGSRLTAEALSRGHRVVAGSRNPGPRQDDGATSTRVDTSAPASLEAALMGADVVILSIRAAAGREADIAGATTAVLDAAAAADVPLLVIGGAGPLRSAHDPDLLVINDPARVPPAWRAVAAASTDQLRACTEHPHGCWTYLSPPAVLEPGTRTGRYRRGTTTLLTAPDGASRISVEDLAVAALDEIERPGADTRFTVAEAAETCV